MIPFTCVDGFFKNPNEVRKYALSQPFFKQKDYPFPLPKGSKAWPGVRTKELSYINKPLFNTMCNKIFSLFYDFNMTSVSWNVSAVFHLTQASHGKFDNLIHQDQEGMSGLVYLNPKINREAGTTIYDKKKKEVIVIKNLYNRMILYDGTCFHGPSRCVNDRLCLVFYVNRFHSVTPAPLKRLGAY
tara:strand:+ start:1328 stop:1885 length:558 start_codon:yes stop_codon:yes gene_type:complete